MISTIPMILFILAAINVAFAIQAPTKFWWSWAAAVICFGVGILAMNGS